jgi:hypothetical protein
MSAAKSSGELPIGVAPSASRRAFTVGVFTASMQYLRKTAGAEQAPPNPGIEFRKPRFRNIVEGHRDVPADEVGDGGGAALVVR